MSKRRGLEDNVALVSESDGAGFFYGYVSVCAINVCKGEQLLLDYSPLSGKASYHAA
jgi:hypothetical protein